MKLDLKVPNKSLTHEASKSGQAPTDDNLEDSLRRARPVSLFASTMRSNIKYFINGILNPFGCEVRIKDVNSFRQEHGMQSGDFAYALWRRLEKKTSVLSQGMSTSYTLNMVKTFLF